MYIKWSIITRILSRGPDDRVKWSRSVMCKMNESRISIILSIDCDSERLSIQGLNVKLLGTQMFILLLVVL